MKTRPLVEIEGKLVAATKNSPVRLHPKGEVCLSTHRHWKHSRLFAGAMKYFFFALVLAVSGCSSAVLPERHIHPPTPQTSLATQRSTRANLSSFTKPIPHISLAWNRSYDADGYKLFWGNASTNLPITQTNITLYMPKGVYTFALYATNSLLSSDPAILRDVPVPYHWPMWIVVRRGTNEVFRTNYPATGPARFWTNGFTVRIEK